MYDSNWKKFPYGIHCPEFTQEVEKPQNLEKVIEISEKLAQGFPLVRVDLYNVNGKIFFWEMTFTPYSWFLEFTPNHEEADAYLWSFINI